MKTRRALWFGLALVLGAALAMVVLTLPEGRAQGGGPVSLGAAPEDGESTGWVEGASVGVAPEGLDAGLAAAAGSGMETKDCYQAGKTQTLCYTINNGFSGWTWLRRIRLTMPAAESTPWAVGACGASDSTDSAGYLVDFDCQTSGNEVVYDDKTGGWDGISPGASWGTCVDVTVPQDYTGPRRIVWLYTAENGGVFTDTGYTEMEACPPIRLWPGDVTIEGCNGAAQRLEFELENFSAGNNADVTLVYQTGNATFDGPTDVTISEGELVTFTTELEPDLCLEPGQVFVSALAAEDSKGVAWDTAIITQTITSNAGWRRREDSPTATMDSVVVWASHEDGGLWSIGGYGSGGAAQRYDPSDGTWITVTNPLTPQIEYPIDGCYGLNSQGDEIVVLFPDTNVTGTLQVFNITDRIWYEPPDYPSGYPVEGRWAQDVVSMLPHTGENVCYLTGGAEQPGGGTTRDLWRYDPAAEVGTYLGHFPAPVWFGFHASWYVPWVGDEGAICIAGGVDHNHQISDSTQCYDLAAGQFNGKNGDLGTLPEPWWGMADGWRINGDGHYEIWIANGVAQDGTLLRKSAYMGESDSGFTYGPPVPRGLYRLEGSGYDGEFYTLNGARGGFLSSKFAFHLGECPTCHQIFLPLTLRD